MYHNPITLSFHTNLHISLFPPNPSLLFPMLLLFVLVILQNLCLDVFLVFHFQIRILVNYNTQYILGLPLLIVNYPKHRISLAY